MNLAAARQLAESIQGQLAPFCEKIEIAGSIRRQRPNVNDIDFVVLPKEGQLLAFRDRCTARARVVKDGTVNYILALPVNAAKRELLGLSGWEVRIDIFIARPAVRDLLQTKPGNFGSLLLLRTGSKEHNIWLIEEAKKNYMEWRTHEGLFDPEGFCVAAETEAEILQMMNVPWIEPERRERP